MARDLNATRAGAPAGEWDKVLIMGKQIAPGDAMFAGSPSASSTDSLDMELHGTPGTLDLTIPAGDSASPDMDLTEQDRGSSRPSGIDFILTTNRGQDESAVLPTIEMPQIPRGRSVTRERPSTAGSSMVRPRFPPRG
jgi:hypothetical protein